MANKQCHICGKANEEQAQACARCAADLSNPAAETLLRVEKSASYAMADKMSALRQYAAVLLTDKRLIVIPAKLSGAGLAGVITAAIVNKMTSKDGVLSLPFSEISAVRDGKFGLLVKAFIVDIKGGEGELVKLTMPKREEWKQEISRRCV